MLGFAVIVGAVIASRGLPSALALALSFATGFFIGASAMVLNDIVDVDVDRINAPWRPLPSGRLTIREAYACFAVLSAAGLLTAAATGVYTFLVALSAWALATLYDLWGKKTGIPGNVMVAFNVAVPLLYGEALVGSYDPTIVVFWAMVFLTALAREVAKGISDIEGDRSAGIRTVAVVRGPASAARLSAALYIAAVLLSPIPVVKGWVNAFTYTPVVAVVDVILVAASLRLMSNPNRETALWHKRVVLAAMLLGLVGFYLGVSL
jgi:geranylgeranylglycerol-phosphate geranylgeranyltransferase